MAKKKPVKKTERKVKTARRLLAVISVLFTVAAAAVGVAFAGEHYGWFEEKPDSSSKETCTHEWGEGEVTVEPTCTEKGEKVYTCGLCEKTQKEILAPKGHTEEVVPGVGATCTENGVADGKICTVCEEVLVEQETIFATGHEYVDGACKCGLLKKYMVTFKNINGNVLSSSEVEHGTVPTCEVPIYTNENYVYTFMGWDKEVVPAVEEATYTARYQKSRNNILVSDNGDYTIPAGYEAKVGTTVAEKYGVNSTVEYTVETKKALGWQGIALSFLTLSDEQTPPVSLVSGTAYRYVVVCLMLETGQLYLGYNKNFTYGAALSADTPLMSKYAALNAGDDISIDIKVNYSPGLFEFYVDGELYFAYGSEKSARATIASDLPVASVIEEHTGNLGLGFLTHVAACPTDVTIKDINVSEYHDWQVKEETPATCTEDGACTYVCELCGGEYSETISATGHAEEEVSAVVPTCTETGSTVGVKCSTCGEVLVSPEEVPAVGHEYGENGECIRCEAVQTEE